MQKRVHLLEVDIQDEERSAGVFDSANAAYPILARTLRARRDNLVATIVMLEGRLTAWDRAA